MTDFDAIRIFVPAAIAFFVGIGLTPFLTHFLYRERLWKKKAGKTALDGTPAAVFNSLHSERETAVPRFGGVVVWGSVLLTALLLSTLARLFPEAFLDLAFVSRSQTWVPFAAFIAGSLVGLFDDFFEVEQGRGLRLRFRLFIVASVALFCAYWFYEKLGVSAISFPFFSQPLELGILFVPFFIAVALFLYAGGVIDGLDGLAGGIFASAFAAYAGIALFYLQYDLAALCAAITGGLLAFLWFNIPPARFYLSETGTMGLTLALTVVAFLTDSFTGGRGISVLPVVALPLVATVFSDVLQVASKKLFGRKLFRVAPLHHHFEAIGWPPYKVTMRYWVVGAIAAVLGATLAIL